MAAAVAVGCTRFKSQIDPDVHNCVVIVHANGGQMNNLEVRTFNMQEGATIPLPSDTSAIPSPAREKHTLLGFYRVELDENNNIVRGEDGEIVWGEKWDFQWDRLEGNVNIAAKWERNVTYEFVKGNLYGGEALGEDFAFSNQEGRLVKSVSDNNTVILPSGSDIPAATGHTLVGYFLDAACTQKITLPYSFSENEVANFRAELAENAEYNLPIYTQWLVGTYNVINDASDLTSFTNNVNYFFDVDELDMTGRIVSFGSTFSGEIIGNGCVIRNISVNIKQARGTVDYSVLFRSLVGASINDLVFDGVTVNFSVEVNSSQQGNERNQNANVSLMYMSKDADTEINNVTCRNVSFEVTHAQNHFQSNPETGGEFVINNYICNVSFFKYGKDAGDLIGSIDNDHETQRITYGSEE